MVNFIVCGKSLIINDNKVDFQFDIKTTMEIKGLIIVMIWNMSTGDIEKQPFNNVYAVNGSGNIIWNIKEIIGKDGIYTLIRQDEFNNLVAVEFIGMNFIIDVNNKKIVGGKAYK